MWRDFWPPCAIPAPSKIFIVGGYVGSSNFLSDVEIFDLTPNENETCSDPMATNAQIA